MAGWPGSLVHRIFANDQACTYLTSADFVHSSCVPCPGRADCRWPWDVQERQSIEEPAMWSQCNLGLFICRTLRWKRWGMDRESSQQKRTFRTRLYIFPPHLTVSVRHFVGISNDLLILKPWTWADQGPWLCHCPSRTHQSLLMLPKAGSFPITLCPPKLSPLASSEDPKISHSLLGSSLYFLPGPLSP